MTLQSQVLDVNARELLQALNLLVQLSPSGLWGEAMHSSGLFSHLLNTSIAAEVRLCSSSTDLLLNLLFKGRHHSAYRTYLSFLTDRIV
jgi:hypothetical protein